MLGRLLIFEECNHFELSYLWLFVTVEVLWFLCVVLWPAFPTEPEKLIEYNTQRIVSNGLEIFSNTVS